LEENREELNVSKEQFATLDDDKVKDILNTLLSDLAFRRIMQSILTKRAKPQSRLLFFCGYGDRFF